MEQESKSKKNFIVLGILLVALAIGAYWYISNQPKSKVLKEEIYTAYVRINPSVAIQFKASYYECTDKKDNVSICGDFKSEIIDIELLNEDAKSLYQTLDIKGQELKDSLISLIKVAYMHQVDISDVKITTNFPYMDSFGKEISTFLQSDIKVTSSVVSIYQNPITEETKKEFQTTYRYTVTFDSDGGSYVSPQSVTEYRTVTKPTDPIKNGYTFVEWQLGGRVYDFNARVKGDITLKAVWDKNKTGDALKEEDNYTLRKQLAAKGLRWDFSSLSEAKAEQNKWLSRGGYKAEIITSSYRNSDTAYSVVVTLNASICGGDRELTIDRSNPTDAMDNAIYYLHSLGYNCSLKSGTHNGRRFTINESNRIIFE